MKVEIRKLGIVLGFAAAFVPKLGLGQSFNVDLDAFGGPPEAGNGAPSASFGAAANQPGVWNRVRANHTGTSPLVNLSGNSTAVLFDAVLISGGGLAFNNPANTGDFALLLNDVGEVEPSGTYAFRGLQNGIYRIVTYAVTPPGRVESTEVFVPGAQAPNPQFVTGPMPGNSFALGITHSDHIVATTDGNLLINIRSLSHPSAYINGFQLILVPEPSGTAFLILSLCWLVNKNKKSAAVRLAIPIIPCRMRV